MFGITASSVHKRCQAGQLPFLAPTPDRRLFSPRVLEAYQIVGGAPVYRRLYDEAYRVSRNPDMARAQASVELIRLARMEDEQSNQPQRTGPVVVVIGDGDKGRRLAEALRGLY